MYVRTVIHTDNTVCVAWESLPPLPCKPGRLTPYVCDSHSSILFVLRNGKIVSLTNVTVSGGGSLVAGGLASLVSCQLALARVELYGTTSQYGGVISV